MTTLYATRTESFEERALFENADGTPKDLTGTFTSFIRVAKYYNTTPIVTISGTIDTPATLGTIKYTATALQMSALDYGSHVYTRYLYDVTGTAVSVVSGSFVIIPSV
jgi:uncharacterized membrane protein